MEETDPKQVLLFALKRYNLEVKTQEGKMIKLEKGYLIEIEDINLFKLLQGGQVIAPFAQVEEMCQFIKMDMQINEES